MPIYTCHYCGKDLDTKAPGWKWLDNGETYCAECPQKRKQRLIDGHLPRHCRRGCFQLWGDRLLVFVVFPFVALFLASTLFTGNFKKHLIATWRIVRG